MSHHRGARDQVKSWRGFPAGFNPHVRQGKNLGNVPRYSLSNGSRFLWEPLKHQPRPLGTDVWHFLIYVFIISYSKPKTRKKKNYQIGQQIVIGWQLEFRFDFS